MVSRGAPRPCKGGCGQQVTVYMCKPCTDRMWDIARQIAGIVQRDPCGGLPELEVQERCEVWDAAMWKAAKFTAYRREWIGFGSEQARGYMFAPPPGAEGRIVAPEPAAPSAQNPFPHRQQPAGRLVAATDKHGLRFGVTVQNGRVVGVAGAVRPDLVGLIEGVAADQLRSEGCTFVVVAGG